MRKFYTGISLCLMTFLPVTSAYAVSDADIEEGILELEKECNQDDIEVQTELRFLYFLNSRVFQLKLSLFLPDFQMLYQFFQEMMINFLNL